MTIRDDALHSAVSYSEKLILAQSLTGIVTIIALCYALYTAFTILTKRVFTQSMNDNINYLLLIPIALCASMGGYCWWMTYLDSTFPFTYYPVLFVSLGACVCTYVCMYVCMKTTKCRMKLRLKLVCMYEYTVCT